MSHHHIVFKMLSSCIVLPFTVQTQRLALCNTFVHSSLNEQMLVFTQTSEMLLSLWGSYE